MSAFTEISQILNVITELQSRLDELKTLVKDTKPPKKGKKVLDPNRPKRAPNSWIQFTQRVSAVLKEAGKGIPRVAEAKKFCASLKAKGAYETWTDSAILLERDAWGVVPTPAPSSSEEVEEGGIVVKDADEVEEEAAEEEGAAVCPVCDEDISIEPEKHKDCIRSFVAEAKARGENPLKAVDAWSSATRPAETKERRQSLRNSRPILPLQEEDMSGGYILVSRAMPMTVDAVLEE